MAPQSWLIKGFTAHHASANVLTKAVLHVINACCCVALAFRNLHGIEKRSHGVTFPRDGVSLAGALSKCIRQKAMLPSECLFRINCYQKGQSHRAPLLGLNLQLSSQASLFNARDSPCAFCLAG